MNEIFIRLKNTPNWLRWTSILPLSVLIYFLVGSVFSIIGMLFLFISRDGYNEKLFTHLVSPYFAGLYCVDFPISIAPSNNRIVGMFLAGLWMMGYGAMAVFGAKIDGWTGILPAILSTAGCLYAVSQLEPQDVSNSA